MGMLLLTVCTDEARTLEEEYEHLTQLMADTGRFFSWEVHPNKMRVSEIITARLTKKRIKVMDEMIALGYY
jgi:hypothetical protein